MPTPEQATEAIYQQWVDNWTATPLADTIFAGEVPPAGFPPEGRSWATVRVQHTSPGGQTLGAAGTRRFRRRGSIFVEIGVPLGSASGPADGRGRLMALGKAALDVFESTRFEQVRTHQSQGPIETGPDQGKWDKGLCEIPFDYDERK